MNSFFKRRYIIQGIFILVALVLLGKLFYIQVIDDRYKLSADNNVLRKLIIYPARGIILDRHEKVLVQNEPVYDLMVIPGQVSKMDTLEFCSLINMTKENFDKAFKKARNYSVYKASLFQKQLSATTYAAFQEKLFEYPGFFVQNRSVRYYPDSCAAQFLGYIGEVNDREIEKYDGFYSQGDYIGKTGIEKSYENLLRGQRGVRNIMVDVHNREQGSFFDGKYDTTAVSGDRLISSLDKKLQLFGEQLMKNKIGSVVAIEPATGEILASISSPSYDPNLMVGRQRGNNYMKFLENPYKPMFIRPIQAEYPPGSIFKVINALVAQQMGLITEDTYFNCPGGYRYGKRGFMGCTHVHGTINLEKSIEESCNTYYGNTYHRMIDQAGMRPVNAYTRWRNAVMKFGIGTELGIDLPAERDGLIPTADYYTKIFHNDKWTSSFNISLSIGQGELGITPLQMANVMAIVANRGYFYKPHLIKAIGEKKIIKKEYTQKNYAGIDQKYFEPVVEGMSNVVNSPSGTAYFSKISDIEICGKTGTVQNPHGKDHSVFVAFAPRNNPKIAIAVVVENAGFGATWSAPIASLMIEEYLRDSITRPQYYIDRILKTNLLPEIKKPILKPVVKKDSSNKKTSLMVSATIAKIKENE
ncbi:MAG: penicillin-binding protein 2 [Bacteroidetes bacterium]|nr:penicillin-binding protein 2 [Bacteroidota bacterium]MBU1373330.1 penicillin-binding protein 2 [Bacteroidota bacterium]MBU1484421.1 penicillin-binding protein 2 [Bacteroidota bacterium]MBU1762215.1 penicillin-binding protein 2 [Bacteroidota bacterium]MBU2046994.1 penicillin-binding protein 2 [Bacteroidota bacterium]